MINYSALVLLMAYIRLHISRAYYIFLMVMSHELEDVRLYVLEDESDYMN